MNLLIGFFVTILVAVVGGLIISLILMPMIGLIAVLANGVDGYKLDKITDKYSLSGKKSALALMTKTMVALSLIASCIVFIFYKIKPSETFMLVLAIIEFCLAPIHLLLGSILKNYLSEED